MSVIAEMIARNGHQGAPSSSLTTESEKSVQGGRAKGGNLGPGL